MILDMPNNYKYEEGDKRSDYSKIAELWSLIIRFAHWSMLFLRIYSQYETVINTRITMNYTNKRYIWSVHWNLNKFIQTKKSTTVQCIYKSILKVIWTLFFFEFRFYKRMYIGNIDCYPRDKHKYHRTNQSYPVFLTMSQSLIWS